MWKARWCTSARWSRRTWCYPWSTSACSTAATARHLLTHLVTCGVASGISAAFNSPIGGVLFVVEDLAARWLVDAHLVLQCFVSPFSRSSSSRAHITGLMVQTARSGDHGQFQAANLVKSGGGGGSGEPEITGGWFVPTSRCAFCSAPGGRPDVLLHGRGDRHRARQAVGDGGRRKEQIVAGSWSAGGSDAARPRRDRRRRVPRWRSSRAGVRPSAALLLPRAPGPRQGGGGEPLRRAGALLGGPPHVRAVHVPAGRVQRPGFAAASQPERVLRQHDEPSVQPGLGRGDVRGR